MSPISHMKNVTSNECIAGNGKILEISDTSEYIKEWCKGSVSLRYKYYQTDIYQE